MEDNSTSDDEVRDSPRRTKKGGKKIKLNDGSSQNSLKKTVGSSSKDENVDSGVSADKSESTSSDDKAAGTSEGPSNEVVSIAPSGSNIQAILLNIRRPRRSRNYRKRKTPERDTDSNASSRDSDDLSADEHLQSGLNDNGHSDTDSDGMRRFMDLGSTESEASNTGSIASPSNSDESYESIDMIPMPSGETDSEDSAHSHWRRVRERHEGNKDTTPVVLSKQRPEHNYIIVREIMHREMGLTFPSGKTTKEDVMFERRFYGSLHAIYRMKKLHSLNKHRGCVNSINFHPEGHLLVSGSDDTNIVVWDWAKNSPVHIIKTGHKSNVFQSKFLHLNAQSQLNIVTCARDGQVRLIQVPSGGGAGTRRRLCTHARAAHKLHVSAAEPHLVLSAGEDGLAMQCDVRADHATRLFQVKNERNLPVPLYSVHGHPLDPKEVVVAGRDKYLRVYDRRKSLRPIAVYCPTTFQDETDPDDESPKNVRNALTHLTCAVYNHDGSEILGSYNDEDIYLFDTKADAKDPLDPQKDADAENFDVLGYTYKFSGHRNSATFKGVSYFGPNSEYIVSGSDCSHIYIWHKKSEAIVQWMQGDNSGVVNCIEAHPRYPVLASSGLDRDVKIWIPIGPADPIFEGLEKVVRENGVSQLESPLFNDFLPTLYSAWSSRNGEPRLVAATESGSGSGFGGNIEFDGNVCTTF